MPRWQDIVAEAPEFAQAVQAAFDAHLHKAVATLRRDGSPRISGTEVNFQDGDVWLGMMGGSMKARDLLRDPRLALHSAMVDITMALGDAKIAGVAVLVDDPARLAALSHGGDDETTEQTLDGAHLFRVDITEVAITRIGDPADHLVIESWHPGRGIERIERK
jgi:hypothetical protein